MTRTRLLNLRDWACLLGAFGLILFLTLVPQPRQANMPDKALLATSDGGASWSADGDATALVAERAEPETQPVEGR